MSHSIILQPHAAFIRVANSLTGKRNTSRSVFTSYERDLAKAAWVTSSARLGRDSFLPFGSCYLCLELARDPVSCDHGDIFCRECAVTNLLAQKKEVKRLAKTRERLKQQLLDEAARHKQETDQRAIDEFELLQSGFTPQLSSTDNEKHTSLVHKAASETEIGNPREDSGKRKHILSEATSEEMPTEDRAKARKLALEKPIKKGLPSFWTPSETPGSDALQATTALSRYVKEVPVCPASPDDGHHPYSLKDLRPINFTEECDEGKPESRRRVCPSCMKTLGNVSRPFMAEKCGHVLCRGCVVKFLTPSAMEHAGKVNVCLVCDEVLASSGKAKQSADLRREFSGLIQLRSEGTGFSARGANTVTKHGVAFQC